MKEKLCAKCLHFYCCSLSQITKDCPVMPKTPQTGHKELFPNPPPMVHPENAPFDYEFGSLRQQMLEELSRQPKPYIPWDGQEGKEL